ncbi:hypothetical protein KSP40_PGU003141 [Platanthera guangdongensis]|uniref:Uncharacterized protein n=1 Tax=Platanthera guangdongensis TaxID=2320717 RepID=A0ABR2LXA0_9ASPA
MGQSREAYFRFCASCRSASLPVQRIYRLLGSSRCRRIRRKSYSPGCRRLQNDIDLIHEIENDVRRKMDAFECKEEVLENITKWRERVVGEKAGVGSGGREAGLETMLFGGFSAVRREETEQTPPDTI